jgi:uncharacterized protein (TIGR00251 family)
MMAVKLLETPAGVRLWIKVVPGSSRDRIVGPLGETLKLSVSKPPSGGAANQAVIALLAATLGVAEKRIRIEAGHTNPRKQVVIQGMSVDDVRDKLGLEPQQA